MDSDLGDISEQTGHSPDQPAVVDHVLSRMGLDKFERSLSTLITVCIL